MADIISSILMMKNQAWERKKTDKNVCKIIVGLEIGLKLPLLILVLTIGQCITCKQGDELYSYCIILMVLLVLQYLRKK